MDPNQNPDLQLGVEFFLHAVLNPRKSKEAKRPVYDDKEYVRIRFPADNKRELVANAHEKHYNPHAKEQMTYAERFQPVYEAFKRDAGTEAVHGTPLAEVTFLTQAKRSELIAQNVKTVEQLAGLPDAVIKKLGMGARDMVESAKSYLQTASQQADTAALHARIAELEAQMAAEPVPHETATDDGFADFTDDDLKNMIRDAGRSVPSGPTNRAKLVVTLQEIAAAKENEAA
jgi:hypothetical protein